MTIYLKIVVHGLVPFYKYATVWDVDLYIAACKKGLPYGTEVTQISAEEYTKCLNQKLK